MAIAGALLIAVNVAVIASLAIGGVEEAVNEAFAVYPKEKVCADDDCSEVNADWAVSTSEQSYYAWSLSNLEAVQADDTVTPEYTEVGPVEYRITIERTLIAHDAAAGTLTYSEVKTYEWSGGTPSDVLVTNLNILYEPQRIGATSLFIDIMGSMTKAGFCAAMIDNDMEVGVPSQRTANALEMDGPNSAWDWADHAYFHAKDPGDPSVSIALTSKWGPALFVGLGAPVESSTSTQRAALFGYTAMDGTEVNESETFVRDQALYALVAAEYVQNGGGDENWDDDMDEVEQRFFEVSGARIADHAVLDDLLYGMDGNTPRGLLVSDSAGFMWGLALFLSAALENPFAIMIDYGLGITDIQKIGGYAGDWFLDDTTFPLILKGGSGSVTAIEFQYARFGGEDPLEGGYSEAGLNLGGFWGSGAMSEWGATGAVDLNFSQVDNILNGPMGVAGDGAVAFLYGEVTGHTLPVDATTMVPTEGGLELPWNTALVAQIYGIDVNEAAALRYFVYTFMFDTQVPVQLDALFGIEATGFAGATRSVTHTIDEWLFGWRDPLMARLAGDQQDLTLGWQSLETNKTYYGSPNVSTGPGTIYTICTGEYSGCDKGEILLQDGSEHLFWRTPEMADATFGKLSAESLTGATGGFITGHGDLLNLGDYAIAVLQRQDDGEHLGMAVEVWTASVDAKERNIQAKLTNQLSVIDIFPGAVPIYFGAEVELKVQPTARIIVAGESTSRFLLDTRSMAEQAQTGPSDDDLQVIFKIESGGGADAETVAQMQSGIVDNQKRFTYWTNFDTGASALYIDQLTAVIYLCGFILLSVGVVGSARAGFGEQVGDDGEQSADGGGEDDGDSEGDGEE